MPFGIIPESRSRSPGIPKHTSAGVISSGLISGVCKGGPCDIGISGFVRDPQGGITIFGLNLMGPYASSINEPGDVAGPCFGGPCGYPSGFVRDGQGNFTTFAVPGASITFPVSINAAGQIVGFCFGGVCGNGSGFVRRRIDGKSFRDFRRNSG